MSEPIILDLFCGQGGAAKGYIDAGFRVVGVDIADHSARYPGEFVQGDAIKALAQVIAGVSRYQFDAIHASPPCQGYSIATAGNPGARAKHERLIATTRTLLQLTGLPWVIENVEQARSQMVDPILLCGSMFGLETEDEDGEPLRLERHRLFESNVELWQPDGRHHFHAPGVSVAGVYGGSRRAKRMTGETLAEVAPRDRYAAKHERKGGYVPRSIRVQQDLLGIDWMTVKGMQESIPPAYSEWVGQQIINATEAVA